MRQTPSKTSVAVQGTLNNCTSIAISGNLQNSIKMLKCLKSKNDIGFQKSQKSLLKIYSYLKALKYVSPSTYIYLHCSQCLRKLDDWTELSIDGHTNTKWIGKVKFIIPFPPEIIKVVLQKRTTKIPSKHNIHYYDVLCLHNLHYHQSRACAKQTL